MPSRSVTTRLLVALVALAGGGCQPAAAVGGSDADGPDSGSGDPAADAAGPDLEGWELVFEDEFDGAEIDAAEWIVYQGPQANSENLSIFAPAQVRTEGGSLRLEIAPNEGDGTYACGGLENAHAYLQTYGRWDARVRFPAGTGNVGYIGLFGEIYTEIDFGEVAGKYPTRNTFTQHYGADDAQDQSAWTGADSTADFHVYTLVWQPGELTWLVDGALQYRTDQRFPDEPLLFAIGDWVSTCDTEWAGCPDAETEYPTTMDIDYVRIYRQAP